MDWKGAQFLTLLCLVRRKRQIQGNFVKANKEIFTSHVEMNYKRTHFNITASFLPHRRFFSFCFAFVFVFEITFTGQQQLRNLRLVHLTSAALVNSATFYKTSTSGGTVTAGMQETENDMRFIPTSRLHKTPGHTCAVSMEQKKELEDSQTELYRLRQYSHKTLVPTLASLLSSHTQSFPRRYSQESGDGKRKQRMVDCDQCARTSSTINRRAGQRLPGHPGPASKGSD